MKKSLRSALAVTLFLFTSAPSSQAESAVQPGEIQQLSSPSESPATPIPFAEIGAKATADYQGDAIGIEATADGARLRTGFQKLAGTVTVEGLQLESTAEKEGQLKLTAAALRRGSGLPTVLPARGSLSSTDKVVAFIRPGIIEEYSVSVDGLRQDFIVTQRPEGAGDLSLELALTGADAEAASYGAKLTLDGSGRTLAYSRLHVTDAQGKELTATMEVLAADRLAIRVEDAGAAYPLRIDPTFSDADWVSLNSGIPGANSTVNAAVVDGSGNLYIGGSFTFAGSVSASRIAKWDGSAWSALSTGMSSNVLALAVSGSDLYAGGSFTTAGGTVVNNIAKWNGSAWSALGTGMGSSVNALVVSGSDLYAGGLFFTAGGSPANRIAKWNGSAWSALGTGMDSNVNALAVSGSDLYAGGQFTTAGGTGANNIAKWNGSAWSALGTGVDSFVHALAVSGSDLYAGGSFTTAGGTAVNRIAKWNGSAWSALGTGVDGFVHELAVSGSNLYAGGDFTTAGGTAVNRIAKWNGSAWSALGTGMSFSVYALAASGSDLYAGGDFTTAGGTGANNIAKWNGSVWSALGTGMNSSVNALAVNGSDLYAGGSFTAAGGTSASRIAKWDGSVWSALGTGMNSSVFALAVSGSDLYAGGNFTTAGGTGANYIAKWNGSVWSALGTGMDSNVNALAVSGSDLYAGGNFATAGGTGANYIAKWNGSVWSALGTGLNAIVRTLAVSGSDLYAGGNFTTAGGTGANFIAKWNGNVWSALGTGMDSFVNALAVSGSDLYAGGSFTAAGGTSASRIAKWNGSVWSVLGSGVGGHVYALAVSGSDLYVGGFFTTASGTTANRIAKWNGSLWSALGTGVDSSVNALAADASGHLFLGGNFTFVGTTTVSPFIAQANLPAPPPTVTSISPSSGSTAGGTSMTITGTGFSGTPSVTIGSVAATSVVVVDATTITCLTPAGTGTNKDVVVTVSGEPSTGGTGLFSYLPPTVTGIAPSSGSTAGGTSVTITGTNFGGTPSVTIGGNPATSVVVNSATSITCTTPAGTVGARDVVVTVSGQSSTGGTGLFTYVAPLSATFNTASDIGVTANGFTATGTPIGTVTLGFAPPMGTALKLVNNTSGSPIDGNLTGLEDGGFVTSVFGGALVVMQASYTGGDGNDLVLIVVPTQWRTMGSPGGDARDVMDAWFANAQVGWAVGVDGMIGWTTNGGATWDYQYVAPYTNLNAVWGTDTNNVWAVGAGGTILKWNGVQWSAQPSGTTQSLNDIHGTDANNLWAVGNSGTILKYDGSAWSAVTSGTTSGLNGVWAISPTQVWAAGSGGVIRYWDGTAWTAQTSGTTATLMAIWAADANSVWAAGSGGVIQRFDGTTWLGVTNPAFDISGIAGSSASDVWIGSGNGAAYHWDGSTWTSIPTGTGSYNRGLYALDASHVWFLGGGSGATTNATITFWNGTAWAVQLGGTSGNSRASLWAQDFNNAWQGFAGPVMMKRSGAAWAVDAAGFSGGSPVMGLWGVDASNVWGVAGLGAIRKWNGSTWAAQTSGIGSGITLSAIHGSSGSNIWAVGDSGSATRYNGTSWGAVSTGSAQTLYDVWTLDSSNAWLVGNSGTIRKWNGASWAAQTSGTTVALFGIWGSSASNIWAVGSSGTILKYNGSAWSAETSGTTQALVDVWGIGSQVWAMGANRTLLRRESGTWIAESVPGGTTNIVRAISGGAADRLIMLSGSMALTNAPGTPEISIDDTRAGLLVDGSGTVSFGGAVVAVPGPSRTLAIKNLGSAFLTGLSTSITGTNPGDFAVTSAAVAPVEGGEGTTLTVQFTPGGSGARSAVLHVTSNDSDEASYDINLTGSGGLPEIEVTGNSVNIADGDAMPSLTDHTDFGVTAVLGTTTRTFTITNPGTGDLLVDNVMIGGANAGDFSVTAQPAAVVAASGSTTFQVTFTPTIVALRTATLSFGNNDSDETPFTFAIQGNGDGAEIAVMGNAVSIADGDSTPALTDHTNFGRVGVISGTGTRTFTINNTGTVNLTLGSVTVGGSASADFTVTSAFTSPMAPGGSTSFTVTFNPSSTGTRSATLSFSTNDADENPFNFSIEGTGSNSGALDLNFDADGMVTTVFGSGGERITSVVVQPDGKIVVAGYAFNGSKNDFAVARYNANGSLDTSFDGDGKATTSIGSVDDIATCMALQSDGKIVVGGYALIGATYDFALVRYDVNGSLDTSFDGDGILTATIGSAADHAHGVAIQTDGKIVLAGYSFNGSNQDFAVVRYDTNGSLDPGFNGTGKVTTAIGSGEDVGFGVALQSDGRILVAGYSHNGSNNEFALVRYLANGTLDTDFNTTGKVTTAIGSEAKARSVAVQSDGRIVIAGSAFFTGNEDFALARLNANGSLDTGFDGDGVRSFSIGAAADACNQVFVQPDGKIVCTGQAIISGNNDFAIARLLGTTGAFDTTFDTDGKVTTAIGAGSDVALAAALQPDSKLVVAGLSNNGTNDDFALVRYISDTADYLVTTTAPNVTVTDISGNGETLLLTAPSAGNIQFAATGRNFSVNGGALVSGNSGSLSLTGITQLTVNTDAGNDTINVSAFTSLPSLTLNGGTGNDVVNFNGDITFATNASLEANLQDDAPTPGEDYVSLATDTNLITSGTGAITIKASKYLVLGNASSSLTTTSLETVNGDITVETNLSGATAGSFAAMMLADYSVIRTSGTGNISINATGGANGSGSYGQGLVMYTSAKIESTASGLGVNQGKITIIGNGGGGNGASDTHGIHLELRSPAPRITTVDGDVVLTGTGSAYASSSSHGIALETNSFVQSAGNGKITLTGTGGGDGTGSGGAGVVLSGSASTSLLAVNGDVTITGTGGTTVAGSSSDYGTFISGGITITGSARLDITGTATGSGADSNTVGVLSNGVIQCVGGDVTILGTVPALTGSSNTGAAVGSLQASGASNIIIKGIAGAGIGNYGVQPFNLMQTVNGSVTIIGRTQSASPSSYGIVTAAASNISTGSGPLSFIGDSMSIQSASTIASTGTITLRPANSSDLAGEDNGDAILLGANDTAAALGLADAELDRFTAGTLTIGNASTGNITVQGAISPGGTSVLNLISGGVIGDTTGGTDINVASLSTSGTLAPGTSPGTFGVVGNHTFVSGSTFAVEFGGTTAGTGYDQLSTTGSVTINSGVALSLTSISGFVPAPGNSFTIINRTGGTGTFTGLAQGATISNFLGSGLDATISYIGGTGDDVVVALGAPPTVTSISPATGSTAGGTSVTITGNSFGGTPSVTIGGNPATSVVVNSATSITCTTPAGTAGAKDVVVTVSGQSSTGGTGLFTYVAPPSVTLSTANLASNATTLTITGTGFSTTPGNNTVAFTPSGTGTVTASTATSLTVTSLTGLTLGALNAVVTTNSLSSGAPVQVATVVAPAPGALDLPFNPNVTGGSGYVYATAVLPDGRMIIGGNFTTVGGAAHTSIARLNADGSVDATFTASTNGQVYSVAVQADGKLVLGGNFTSVNGSTVSTTTGVNRIARLNADGTRDTAFNAGLGGANSDVLSVAVQADGKLVIGGGFTSVNGSTVSTTTGVNRIARLNADGTRDTAFNAGLGGANDTVTSVAVQADGKLVLGGLFTSVNGSAVSATTGVNRIARLNADGTLDTAFNAGLGGANDAVRSVAVQADGKLLLGGFFLSVNGSTPNATTGVNRIARLNADGTLDTAFNAGLGGANNPVHSVAVQADGKLVLGGGFTSVNGSLVSPTTGVNCIARLNADGTRDTAFNAGLGGANSIVYSVAVQADGKLVLGGQFTSVNGTTRNLMARLTNDAATQSLSAPDTTQALWTRGGAGPELSAVTFEQSTDGGNSWTPLGAGTRVGSTPNWQRTGLSLPTTGHLRARGRTTSGYFNGGSGLIEQVVAFSGLTTPAPTVTSISPSTGSTAGGTSVTITGTGFTGATAVTVGGVAVSSFTVVNSTTITAILATAASGSSSVLVTTPGGTNAANTLFLYKAPPVANAQSVTLDEDKGKVIVLTGNLANPGTFLSYTIVTPPANGTLTGTGPTQVYSPLAHFNGSDSFTFRVNDGALDSTTATVNLTITPVAEPAQTGPAFPEFIDPNPSGGNGFGTDVVPLNTGNVVITSPQADVGGTDTGAVYLFNGATGALISTLTGSTASDRVGTGGVTALTNGNYVVSSIFWDNGAVTNAGAVTWGNGTTGISGAVSTTNSLVGSTASDNVGSNGVTALTNGNYVVSSQNWDNGAVADAGAVTWGNGTTGVSGAVSTANSLVGSTVSDQVGRTDGVTALTNGNYVVRSINWDNGAVADAGAVTWGNGTTGISGAVSTTNSLVGSTASDQVGSSGVTALTNGNYVVRSQNWDNGAVADAGAVTWGNGTTGISGAVSTTNSIVGSTASDEVGYGGVTALTNGNYVVSSISWHNGAVNAAGAVTWGNGTTGISGAVSTANSLVGSTAGDRVGIGGVTALTNGNYVVISQNWDNGAVNAAGAVTWGNGTTGISGAVSTTNSLVGSTAEDNVGNSGVTALTNGNYVVRSRFWDNGAVADAGAVTWRNGTTGISGAVSTTNSLVGSKASDLVGNGSVTALTNGNYVVSSPICDNGAVNAAGAVTWGNGTTGISGAVSTTNSLVGSTASDQVGFGGVTALTNGNYVVRSGTWDNGAVNAAGAVTWGNGTTGISGAVSTTNSLVGSTAEDNVGGTVTALTNGNYVVRSQYWDNAAAAATDAGAVTWGNGTTGISGAVSTTNSLVGSTASDLVGNGSVTALTNGNYVVRSANWDNGALGNAGAVTWGNGTTGISGAVSTTNSLVGLVTSSGLGAIATDNVNNPFYAPFVTEGKVRAGSQENGFAPLPTVTAIAPSSGGTAGGTIVTISGTNFSGTPSVTIGSVAATSVLVVDANTITCLTPAGTGTNKDVVVTVSGRPSTGGTGLFSYLPPTVASISPTSGSTAGGTSVTLTGTNFGGTPSVTIGGAAATSVVVVDSSTITCTTPAGTAGAKDVVVTVSGQSSIGGTGLFTYVAPPTITSISPATGSTAGGTSVTITGTGFTGATAVTIGGTAATSVVVSNDTTITAVTPAGSAGSASVLVTTPGGTNAANSLYTYVAPPTVTASSANLLSTATTLTITGTNFSTTPGQNTVAFTPAGTGTVTASTATSLTVTGLSGLTLGALNAVVTTNGQSSGAAVQVATVVAPGPGDLDPLNANVVGSYVAATAVQPDGKTIIAGNFSSVLGQPRNNIARLNADGTLDAGFNPNANGFVYSVAVQADGQILLGGSFTSVGGTARNRIARVAANGTLDAGFNPNANNYVYSVAVQADGQILLGGGFSTVGGTGRNLIARVAADGTLDAGFNPNANGVVRSVAVQADGQILLGGFFTTVGGTGRNKIARLAANGTLDAGFNPNASSDVLSVAVQADGQILLGGDFTSVGGTARNHIARVAADGTLDAGFNPNASGLVYSIAVQTDGKILLGGFFTTVGGTGRNNIARVTANGTLDVGFNPNANSEVLSVAVQADGQILLGGWFTTVGGTGRNLFARLVNDPAMQSLTIPSASRVQWLRAGASPEVEPVTFELSTDGGMIYSALGAGTRISGGWERTGLTLPASGHIRARGRTTGGYYNGTSGLVEAVASFSFPPTVTASTANLASNATTLTINGTGFSTTPGNNTVAFTPSGTGTVTASTATSLTVTSLSGLTLGALNAVVTTNSLSSGAPVQVATVIPPLSNNANLANLVITTATLNPGFSSGITSYNASVPSTTLSVTATPTVTQAGATVQIRVNGGAYSAVASTFPSGPLALLPGANPIDVRVTAQNGTTTLLYTVVVTRTATSPVSSAVGDVVTANDAPDETGANSGLKFDVLRRGGYLSEDGQLVFPGYLLNVGGPAISGVWKDDGTGLKLLALTGNNAPETGTTLAAYDVLPQTPAINDSGEVTFLASLAVGSGTPVTTVTTDTALWSEVGSAGLSILMRESDSVPTIAGATIGAFASGCFATAHTSGTTGEAAFAITMKGTTTDTAILRASVSSTTTAVQVVARENTNTGVGSEKFGNLAGGYTDALRMDATGNLAFVALTKPSARESLWYQPAAPAGGAPVKVFMAGTAATGDIAPGTGGATFKNIKSPTIGSGGVISFRGQLNLNGDNATNLKNDGIWRGTGSDAANYQCILRRGDDNTNRAGFGLPVGAKVGNVWAGWLTNANRGAWRGWLDVNGNGVSSTADGDVNAIYSDLSGVMRYVVRVGGADDAPGMPAGAKFAAFDLPVVGGAEQMVFLGNVTGGGTTAANNSGIWRSAANGGALSLVVRTGDVITTTQGAKTIRKVDFPASEMTDRRWEQPIMDSTGRLIVFVTFMDGSTSHLIVP